MIINRRRKWQIRKYIQSLNWAICWWNVEPAVQCKLVGDNYPDGFIHGHSMKNSQSSNDMKFVSQRAELKSEDGTVEVRIFNLGDNLTLSEIKRNCRILTEYERRDVRIVSVLEFDKGTNFLRAYSVFESDSAEKQTLEMASSFNICAFPCVGKGLRQKDLVLHRLKSKWRITDEAIAFYKKCAPIIKAGRNIRYGPYQNSYNDLNGWQAVVRVAEDGKSLMAVVNTFKMNGETTVEFELPVLDNPMTETEEADLADNSSKTETESLLSIERNIDIFARPGINIEVKDDKVRIQNLSDFDGLVIVVLL